MDGLADPGPGMDWRPLHATEAELKDSVAGFVFVSGGDEHSDRNETICKIVGRDEPDGDDLGPAFLVKFGDGHVIRAYAEELRPWYPT